MVKNEEEIKMDWIQGEKFWKIADFIYYPGDYFIKNDYNRLNNTLNCQKLFDGCVIYTHTMYVRGLFALLEFTNTKVIIITHNSDDNIDESYIPAIPPCVVKWYTQNVNCNDPRIESIPIGLENNRWFPKVHKKEKILALLDTNTPIKNLLYINHNVNTNPEKRTLLYSVFSNESWVTVENGKNGISFDNYITNIYNHRFVACPEGNGIDTHRLWECLYLGTIPIVVLNHNTQFYKDLPICFIDNWEAVTEEFLRSELIRIQTQQWNIDKLTFTYWKNVIKNTKI